MLVVTKGHKSEFPYFPPMHPKYVLYLTTTRDSSFQNLILPKKNGLDPKNILVGVITSAQDPCLDRVNALHCDS